MDAEHRAAVFRLSIDRIVERIAERHRQADRQDLKADEPSSLTARSNSSAAAWGERSGKTPTQFTRSESALYSAAK